MSRARAPSIVLAEDDADMRGLVADVLRKEGYLVHEASDGGRLLGRLAHEFMEDESLATVDLIITDVRMPVCSGLEIVENLREARWQVPVILMTAFGDESTRRRAEALDAVLFDKPFDMADLRAAVARLVARVH